MSALNKQPGGTHYKQMAIQPVQYIHANGLGYCEANIVKYVSRWRGKNGLEDLLKARHYIDLLIELEGLEKADFGQQNTLDCRTDEQKGFNDPRTVEGVKPIIPELYTDADQAKASDMIAAAWEEGENRMEQIGANGPTGEHYIDLHG